MSWHTQYSSVEHARFYAGKPSSSLARRLSNYFEQRIVLRCLNSLLRRGSIDRVLDCASGAGRLLPLLAKYDVSVTALDTSKAMLDEGRRYDHLFRRPPLRIEGSACAMPLSDQSVDVAVCSRLLHHFPDAESRIRILQELARVARVGIVITFFDAWSYHGWHRNCKKRSEPKRYGRIAISRAQCSREGKAAGLRIVKMSALLRFHTELTAAALVPTDS